MENNSRNIKGAITMFAVNKKWIRNHIYGNVDIFEQEKGEEWQSGIFWAGDAQHYSLLYISDYYNPLRDVIDYYRNNHEVSKTTEISNLNVGFL
jgi:hypothetical protein